MYTIISTNIARIFIIIQARSKEKVQPLPSYRVAVQSSSEIYLIYPIISSKHFHWPKADEIFVT